MNFFYHHIILSYYFLLLGIFPSLPPLSLIVSFYPSHWPLFLFYFSISLCYSFHSSLAYCFQSSRLSSNYASAVLWSSPLLQPFFISSLRPSTIPFYCSTSYISFISSSQSSSSSQLPASSSLLSSSSSSFSLSLE